MAKGKPKAKAKGKPKAAARIARRPAAEVRAAEEGEPQPKRKAAKTTTNAKAQAKAATAASSSEPRAPPIEILYEGERQQNGVTFDKTLHFGQEHYEDFLHSLFARLPPAAVTALPAWMNHLGQLSIGILHTKIFQQDI
jgi:hypothetical protein